MCILVLILLVLTPFIIRWWPRGPHWDGVIRNQPSLLWKVNNTLSRAVGDDVAVGNLDADPAVEIVSTEFEPNERTGTLSRVVVRRGDTGVVKWYHEFIHPGISRIALGDIDQDGMQEIVCAVQEEGIFALDGDGEILWSHIDTSIQTRFDVGPAIANVLGDTESEVVAPSAEGRLLLLNSSTGELLWDADLEDTIESPMGVGDIDGKEGREIVVSCGDHRTYAFSPGNDTPLWVRSWAEPVEMSAPIIADLNGDADAEVLIANEIEVAVLDGADGHSIWRHAKSHRGIYFQLPAIGDLDGDGHLEVVFSQDRDVISALRGHDGSTLWTFDSGGAEWSKPSIGDFDGDGRDEILVFDTDDSLLALNGEDASVEWSYRIRDEFVVAQFTPAISDVNNDERLDIVVPCSGSIELYALEPQESGQYIYWNARGGTANYTYTYSLADVDSDFDGLSDSFEQSIGTDISFPDSDGDSMPDAWEHFNGFDPSDPAVSWEQFLTYNSSLIVLAIIGVSTVTIGLIIIRSRICTLRKRGPNEGSSSSENQSQMVSDGAS